MMASNDPLLHAAHRFLLRREAQDDRDDVGDTPRTSEARQVRRAWDVAGMLADEPDIRRLRQAAMVPADIAPREVDRPHRRWAVATALAAAAAAGAVAWIATPATSPGSPTQVAAATAPRATRQAIALPDGSRVLVDARSSVRIAFTPHERRVILTRGRAYFDVRHAATPFVVQAAGGEILDLGTRFVVEATGAATRVSLIEGQVQVRTGAGSHAVSPRPGETVTFARDGGTLRTTATPGDPRDWTTGRLTFDATPLSDAVRTLSRYTAHPIVVDTALARRDRRLTGVFLIDRHDEFGATVAMALDLKLVREADGTMRLMRK